MIKQTDGFVFEFYAYLKKKNHKIKNGFMYVIRVARWLNKNNVICIHTTTTMLDEYICESRKEH